MTREEFNSTKWGANMKCNHPQFGELDVVSVNFGEALIALDDCGDPGDPSWYRCESVELV